MNDMTVAMTEAYFRAPPVSDVMRTSLYGYVLACPISASPWIWNAGLGMLTHRHTGVAKPRTGFKAKPIEPYFDVRSINAEVAVSQHQRDWLEGDIQHPTVVDTKPVPPEAGSARDESAVRNYRDPVIWSAEQQPLKRAEQKRRAKGYHPNMRNVTPRDHMTPEDVEHFERLAREIMANFCHLTHMLPQCKILASKMTFRFLEAVEWEMINVAEWGNGLTKKIEEAVRAYGAPHGPQRADASDDLSVERWEQQREGARFQYHWLRLIFRSWEKQMVDTFSEYGALMQGNNYHGRLGIEHTGHTWEYVPVLQRQREKKQRKVDVNMRSEVHRAALIGKTPEQFEAYYERQTGFKPRKGKSVRDQATPEVAQPMSESEASWMDDEAGYSFDDDGNVVD